MSQIGYNLILGVWQCKQSK